MRLRLIVALTVIASLMSLATVFPSRTTVKATTASARQKTSGVQRKPIQPDLPGTVSGATNPEAIPDTVAFVFLMGSIVD
jgi:hypothetical protein